MKKFTQKEGDALLSQYSRKMDRLAYTTLQTLNINNYLKNVLAVFFLIWIVAYFTLCYLSFEILNPLQFFWDVSSSEGYRFKALLAFFWWIVASVLLASPVCDFDLLGVNKDD